MTKKKYSRSKHQKDVSLEDTSEEEVNLQIPGKSSCQHVAKGIHFGRIKKSLKSSQNILTCNGCSNSDVGEQQELPEVWLCLQCGHRGCGRTSENKHGLQHFKTLHSDCHSLVLSTTSGSVWCYDCDEEVDLSPSIRQCIEFVMKMLPNDANGPSTSNVNKSVKKNLQNSVIKEETSIQNSEESTSIEKSNKPMKSNKASTQKVSVKGLRNLGNTCFFNAVMQNLTQTSLFFHELQDTCSPSHLWEVPELFIADNDTVESHNANTLKISLPRLFPLTNSLFKFLEEMRSVSSSKAEVVNPSPLFGEISKKCPQFRHFQQQDSHELLRQLLDGVRQEEIKRQKKAVLRYFDLENVSPDNVDEEMKKLIKAYACYASHTVVEKVFGGLLISTVLCEECKTSSQVFEPFMDLSLPLFEEKQENNEQLCGMLDGGKQEHIKPLRNKKNEWDSEDNTQGEHSFSKPKNDLGKPSKHQEKKQKQLAKKEKKRAKTIAKNRKNLQSENCDNSTVTQGDEAKVEENEDVNDDSDDEPESHAESGTQKEEQQQETCEVPKLCSASDDENVKENSEAYSMKPKMGLEKSNSSDETPSSNTEKSQIEVNVEDSLIPDVADVKCSIETKVEEDGTNEHNSVEPETSGNTMGTTEQELNKEMEVECLKNVCDEIENLFLSKKNEFSENNSEESAAILTTNQSESTDDNFPYIDNSLDSLTEDFNGLKRDCSESNLNDRIQALSRQVKDVRIRRDSDRQEDFLNTSESTDGCESLKTNCTSPKSSVEDTCSVDNSDNWSHSVSEQQTKDWISKTLTTLKARHHIPPLECSINSCLSHFTKPELLMGNNKFRCENCTQLKIEKTGNNKDVVYSNASKQMLIFSPPAVLTLHLKRFQQVGMSLRKVNRFVEFPLILDLSPYCCSACLILPHISSVDDEILYSLYGVVEHSGRLTSGHYTAYVKASQRTINRTFECELPLAQCDLEQLLHKFSGAKRNSSHSSAECVKEDSKWFYVSDSLVKEVSEASVLKCQAYLLFYERIK